MSDDAATFSALYARYANNVYQFALYLCGNRDEAQDITSETFARVWTSATPVRTESVKAYLLTIARNVYLHEQRRHTRRTSLPVELADSHPTADITLEQRDHIDAVRDLRSPTFAKTSPCTSCAHAFWLKSFSS